MNAMKLKWVYVIKPALTLLEVTIAAVPPITLLMRTGTPVMVSSSLYYYILVKDNYI